MPLLATATVIRSKAYLYERYFVVLAMALAPRRGLAPRYFVAGAPVSYAHSRTERSQGSTSGAR